MSMQVRDGMSDVVLTIGPDLTLQEAARQMARRSAEGTWKRRVGRLTPQD